MILVFLLLIIFIIINLIIFIMLLSNIKLNIKKLHIVNKNSSKNKIVLVSKIGLYLFDKIKLFSITIDNKKIKKLYSLGKIDINKIKNNKNLNKDTLKALMYLELKIERLKVNGYIGTENAALTSGVITLINVFIPIILSKKTKSIKENEYQYKIQPVYVNQNIVNLEINCIISIKMVHIINMIYILFKKGRVKENERTSNRRSYAYSNE